LAQIKAVDETNTPDSLDDIKTSDSFRLLSIQLSRMIDKNAFSMLTQTFT